MPKGGLESGIIETLSLRRIEHAAEEEVRFDRSIDARSARIACGFYIEVSTAEYND
jgi:hypothetical protein